MKRTIETIIGSAYVLADRPALGGVAALNWVAGKINILKEDLTVYDPTGADAAYDGDIYVIRFDIKNITRLSFRISKRDISKYCFVARRAATKRDVTITMPAAPVIGETYGVSLIDPHDREVVYNGRKIHTYVARTAVQADLTDALVLKINGDPTSFVTASNAADDLNLVANDGVQFLSEKDRFHSFLVSNTDSLVGAVITENTAHDPGAGTFDEVTNLEFNYDLGYKGHLNRVIYEDTPDRYADAACEYAQFVIEHDNAGSDTVSNDSNHGSPLVTVVALKYNGTGAAAFKTAIEIYMDLALDSNQG